MVRGLYIGGKIIKSKDMVIGKVRLVVTLGRGRRCDQEGVGELPGPYLMTSLVTTRCPFILLQTVHITCKHSRNHDFSHNKEKIKMEA